MALANVTAEEKTLLDRLVVANSAALITSGISDFVHREEALDKAAKIAWRLAEAMIEERRTRYPDPAP